MFSSSIAEMTSPMQGVVHTGAPMMMQSILLTTTE